MRILCRADGDPVEGVLVLLRFKARRKNGFPLLTHASDARGIAQVSEAEVKASVEWHTGAFPMDYLGLPDLSGEVEVRPVGRAEMARCLQAYELYHNYLNYSAGYADALHRAQTRLDALAPATLTVEVEHDGEGLSVRAESSSA